MRPTKTLGDASRPPTSDPGTSLLLIAVILASLVAASYPVATAGLAALAVVAFVVRRMVRITENGYVCFPKIDRCYRLVPA